MLAGNDSVNVIDYVYFYYGKCNKSVGLFIIFILLFVFKSKAYVQTIFMSFCFAIRYSSFVPTYILCSFSFIISSFWDLVFLFFYSLQKQFLHLWDLLLFCLFLLPILFWLLWQHSLLVLQFSYFLQSF